MTINGIHVSHCCMECSVCEYLELCNALQGTIDLSNQSSGGTATLITEEEYVNRA